MGKATDPFALQWLAEGLAAVAPRLGPAAAKEAASPLAQAMGKATDPDTLKRLAGGLAAVAARLDPAEADAAYRQAAAAFTLAMSKAADPGVMKAFSEGLQRLLNREAPGQTTQRIRSVVGTLGLGAYPMAAIASSWLYPVAEPLPPQTLIDVLKHPLCVGEARRLVLDQLQRHYHRPFADQWDFVRFAEENKIGLDLASPPQ
jgi:hypothetical protein